MFLLLSVPFFFIVLAFNRKGNPFKVRPQVYEKISTIAVNNNQEFPILAPSDLPDEIDFFLIEYSLGKHVYRMCRHSVTVPLHVKKTRKDPALNFVRAIAIDELGQTRDVTRFIAPFAGPKSDFIGNEISLVKILKHHGICDVFSVITVSKTTEYWFKQTTLINLHTDICVTQLSLSQSS